MRKCQFYKGFLLLEISISILLFISITFYIIKYYNIVLDNYIFSFTRVQALINSINIIEKARYENIKEIYYFDNYMILCKVERDKFYNLDEFFWLILDIKFNNSINKNFTFRTGIYK